MSREIVTQLRASNDQRAVKAAYLLNLLDESAAAALEGRNRNRKRASAIHVVTVILTTTVTVLLGIQISTAVDGELKRIAFIIGAIVTLLNAFDPFFHYRGSWTAYDEALAEFYRIRTGAEFYLSGIPTAEIDVTVLDKFRDEHQAAWDRVQKAYRQSRRVSNPEGAEHGSQHGANDKK